jgi:hypothetical protein
MLRVELHGADVVEVAEERKEAAAQLVVPNLDLIIVAARHEERLHRVKADTAHRAVVLVKPVQQRAHAVVPELHNAVVKRGEHPGPAGVEGQALHPVALGLELGEHG